MRAGLGAVLGKPIVAVPRTPNNYRVANPFHRHPVVYHGLGYSFDAGTGVATPATPQEVQIYTTLEVALNAYASKYLSGVAQLPIDGQSLDSAALASYSAVSNDVRSRFLSSWLDWWNQALANAGGAAGTPLPSDVQTLASLALPVAAWVNAALAPITVPLPAPPVATEAPSPTSVPSQATPSTVAQPPAPASTKSLWPWLVGGGVLVLGAVGTALALRRKSGRAMADALEGRKPSSTKVARLRGDVEFFKKHVVMLRDENGRVLESVGGVDTYGNDPYTRVLEAELASEALHSLRAKKSA